MWRGSPEAKGPQSRTCCLSVLVGRLCWPVPMCPGILWLSLHPVYLCFWRVPTDHNPPFFAFSSCLHFPKSIYEGNFGCGYLKERRASGLVFCENTTSVYRALFVSPPSTFFCVQWRLPECGRELLCSLLIGMMCMLLSFSCMTSVTKAYFLLCCQMWLCCDVGSTSDVRWTNLTNSTAAGPWSVIISPLREGQSHKAKT